MFSSYDVEGLFDSKINRTVRVLTLLQSVNRIYHGIEKALDIVYIIGNL